jgi:hypothetical protein
VGIRYGICPGRLRRIFLSREGCSKGWWLSEKQISRFARNDGDGRSNDGERLGAAIRGSPPIIGLWGGDSEIAPIIIPLEMIGNARNYGMLDVDTAP